MGVKENVRKLRKQAGLTQEQLASKIGVTRSTVTQWESGWSKPRMGAAENLAAVFNVPVSAIVDDTFTVHYPPNAIKATASSHATLPLVGRVHAGTPTEPDNIEREIELPAYIANAHPNAYFLEVEGDCMDKVYPEGCHILVDPTQEPQNGSIAAVMIDGREAVMRRLHKGANTIVLSPESNNPEHEDIVITSHDDVVVALIGTVVWFQAREEMK